MLRLSVMPIVRMLVGLALGQGTAYAVCPSLLLGVRGNSREGFGAIARAGAGSDGLGLFLFSVIVTHREGCVIVLGLSLWT